MACPGFNVGKVRLPVLYIKIYAREVTLRVTFVPHAAKRQTVFQTVMSKKGKKILSTSMPGIVLSNCLSSCPSSPKPSRPPLEPSEPPVQWVPGFFSRLKWHGHGVDHSPPSTAEVTNEFTPHTPSCSITVWTGTILAFNPKPMKAKFFL